MPYPTISNVYRVALKWQGSGVTRPAVNVMHIRKASSSALAVWTEVDAKVTAAMWGHTAAGTSVYEVDVTPLDGTSATAQYATGSPAKWTGSAATSDVIPQVACIAKLGTATRGRSFRGRLFLPFLCEGVTFYGTIQASTITSMQAAWNTFFAALTADSYELVVASYKLSSATAVTGVVIENRTGTQRRRQQR